jgi:hypothetical protein
MMLKYVVTGTGRCGTLFMANLLTSMGIPCGHEAVFTTKGMDWATMVMMGRRFPRNSLISRGNNLSDYEVEIAADSSFMAAPFLGRVGCPVIHVVRNPIKVVASMTGGAFRNFTGASPAYFDDIPEHNRHEKFIYDHLPQLRGEMPQLDRACLFYLGWNRMIEEHHGVTLRHRIEDEVGEVKKALRFVGKAYDDRECNSFGMHNEWTPEDLESKEIRSELEEMMTRYGY